MSSKALRLKMAEALERSRATKSVAVLKGIIEDIATEFVDKRLRLTEDQKEAIASSKLSVPELADEFNVSAPTIRKIRRAAQVDAATAPKKRRR